VGAASSRRRHGRRVPGTEACAAAGSSDPAERFFWDQACLESMQPSASKIAAPHAVEGFAASSGEWAVAALPSPQGRWAAVRFHARLFPRLMHLVEFPANGAEGRTQQPSQLRPKALQISEIGRTTGQ